MAVTQASATTTFGVNPGPALDQVLVRTAPDGTKTFYVYGLGLLHEQNGATVRYYHHDRRGDTVLLTSSTGSVLGRVGYGVYGEIAYRTGQTDTPFLFNGRWGVQTDSNGLYYHRARYYHPALRRFLNHDSVLGSIMSSASLNRFAYANGNPGDPVLVHPTPAGQNRGAGASLGRQASGVSDGETIIIVPKETWPRPK